jgi:hypothetical protein
MTNFLSITNKPNLIPQKLKTDNPPLKEDERYVELAKRITNAEFDNPPEQLFEDQYHVFGTIEDDNNSLENDQISLEEEDPIPFEIPDQKGVSNKRKNNTEEQNPVKKSRSTKDSANQKVKDTPKYTERKQKNKEKVLKFSNCKEPQNPPTYTDFKSHQKCKFEDIYNDKNMTGEQKSYLVILIIKDIVEKYGNSINRLTNLKVSKLNLLHPINRYFSFDKNGTISLYENKKQSYSNTINFPNAQTQSGNVVAIGKIIEYLFNKSDFKEKNIPLFNVFQKQLNDGSKWNVLEGLSSIHNALVDFNFKDVKEEIKPINNNSEEKQQNTPSYGNLDRRIHNFPDIYYHIDLSSYQRNHIVRLALEKIRTIYESRLHTSKNLEKTGLESLLPANLYFSINSESNLTWYNSRNIQKTEIKNHKFKLESKNGNIEIINNIIINLFAHEQFLDFKRENNELMKAFSSVEDHTKKSFLDSLDSLCANFSEYTDQSAHSASTLNVETPLDIS